MSQLRIDFETFAALEWQVTEFDKDADGVYLDDNVQSMWIGYKGGRAGDGIPYEQPPQQKDDE